MNKIDLEFSNVEIGTDGAVKIGLWEHTPEQVRKQLAEIYARQVRGRVMTYKQGDNALVFDPYNTGQNACTVRQKEVVGQVVVTKSTRQLKFALSLPLSMSQSLMSLTLMEQASLVAEALRTGLYERMMSGDSQTPSASLVPPNLGGQLVSGDSQTPSPLRGTTPNSGVDLVSGETGQAA